MYTNDTDMTKFYTRFSKHMSLSNPHINVFFVKFLEGAVVDPRLKVIGVDGVRVIDASVFPTVPSGNINAPIVMVAEKGSDMVKEDWLKESHFK